MAKFEAKLTQEDVAQARERVAAGTSLRKVAVTLDVAHTTLARRIAAAERAEQDAAAERDRERREARAAYDYGRRHYPDFRGQPERGPSPPVPLDVPPPPAHEFACGRCPATFPSEAALRRHAERHHGERPVQRRPFVWRDERFPGRVALCFPAPFARQVFGSGSWGWRTDEGAKEGLHLLAEAGRLYRAPSDEESGHWEVWVPAAASPSGHRTRAVVVPGCSDSLQVHRLVRGLHFDAKEARSFVPSAGEDYRRWIAQKAAARRREAAAPPDPLVIARTSSGAVVRTRLSNAEAKGWTLQEDAPATEGAAA